MPREVRSGMFLSIPEFPGYEVAPDGTVRDAATGRECTRKTNGSVSLRTGSNRKARKGVSAAKLAMMVHEPEEYARVYTRNGDDTFLPIPGFPRYEMSATTSAIRRISSGVTLRPSTSHEGYRAVSLTREGAKSVGRLVHRLAMMTHRPDEYRDDLTVDHIDGDPGNNRLDNLRMATGAQQNANRRAYVVTGNNVAVVRVDADGRETTFPSVSEAARQNGVTVSNVCGVLRGRVRTSGGFTWRYAHDPSGHDDGPEGEEWRSAGTSKAGHVETLVSSAGRVRVRIRGVSGRTRRPGTRSGYPVVTIGGVTTSVHLLVARAFLGPPPFEGAVVNHMDGDKTNPAAANLEWTTQSGNLAHAWSTGLRRPGKRARLRDTERTRVCV